MPSEEFECRQCGSCCLNLSDAFQGEVEDEDVKRWVREGRNDIPILNDSIATADGLEEVHQKSITEKKSKP